MISNVQNHSECPPPTSYYFCQTPKTNTRSDSTLLLPWQLPNRPWKLEADLIPSLLPTEETRDRLGLPTKETHSRLGLPWAYLIPVFLGADTDPPCAINNSFLETREMACWRVLAGHRCLGTWVLTPLLLLRSWTYSASIYNPSITTRGWKAETGPSQRGSLAAYPDAHGR